MFVRRIISLLKHNTKGRKVKKQISVMRLANGTLYVSAMVRGEFESQVYIGYTEKEAVAIFRQKFGI